MPANQLRAYVRRGEERAAWFFATSFASPWMVIPRALWRLPWARGSGSHEARWRGDHLERLRWSLTGANGDEALICRGTGEAPGTLAGFSSPEETLELLTDPTIGYLRRRSGEVVTYAVWRPPNASLARDGAPPATATRTPRAGRARTGLVSALRTARRAGSGAALGDGAASDSLPGRPARRMSARMATGRLARRRFRRSNAVMRVRFFLVAAGGFAGLLLHGCTVDFDQYRTATTCLPGETVSCTGPGQCQGTQICAPDGASFSACACDGTGGGNTGGSSAGGNNTGGDTGGSSAGGSGTGGNPGDCPSTQPSFNESCSTPGTICLYGDDHCECWNGEWSCDECPSQQPNDNASCSSNFNRCFYGNVQCFCLQGDWECASCPANAPNDNAPCNDPGLHCTYGATECSCFGGDWHC